MPNFGPFDPIPSAPCRTTVFAKIGRVASEEVTRQLIKSKRLRVILIYGLKECPLTIQICSLSLDFVINRFFMKLLITLKVLKL